MNWMLIAMLVIGLSGCEMLGLSDPETQNPNQKTQPTKPNVNPTPPPKPVETVEEGEYKRPEYPNNTRRNPFQPDATVVQPVATVKSEARPKEPLEQYSLGELELVAIISSVAVPKAMFVDPNGFGHVLKEGDRIGRNSGVVADIRDNEVEVREGNDEDGQTRVLTVQLREAELASGDDSALSDEERDALQQLLESKEGREALERAFQDATLGASSVDKKESNKNTSGQPVNNRFKGIRPPSQ